MIKREEIQKLAELSRITLTEEEESTLVKDIDAIIGYVQEVEKATVGSVDPTVGDFYNVVREDADSHESSAFSKELIEAAPKNDGTYITVKRILG